VRERQPAIEDEHAAVELDGRHVPADLADASEEGDASDPVVRGATARAFALAA
jgi:hypothetical protein